MPYVPRAYNLNDLLFVLDGLKVIIPNPYEMNCSTGARMESLVAGSID